MRKFSITDKLIIASLSISIVTIIIVASFSFYRTKNAILNRTFNQLKSVRVIKTNLLEKFFSNCIKEVQLASSSSDIKNILFQINNFNDLKTIHSEQGHLTPLSTPFIKEISKKYFSRIVVIGKNELIYSIKNNRFSTNETDTDYTSLFKKTIDTNTILISDFVKDKDIVHNVIRLSTKVNDVSNKLLGVIVFEIPSRPIDDVMLESTSANGLGVSGESYLVGDDYLMRSSSRFLTNSILRIQVNTDAVDSAVKNLSGIKIIKDYRGIKVLSSYGRISIPGLNWIILAEIDYKEATIPIYRIRNEIVFISIFIFLIVIVLVILFSRRITVPIEKLNQAVNELGTGNLDIKLNTKLNDEIGELTDSFNNMIGRLKYQSEKIKEEQVKSLTSLIDGQELERQRLSRELHDSLGQLLIGLKLKYESCLNQLDIPETKNKEFDLLESLFDKTIDETRRISNNLMPAALSEFGLITAIRNTCNEISETTNIAVYFTVNNYYKINNSKIQIYIFRIIQEALTNILKHSKAEEAKIDFNFLKNSLQIKINDNGNGFDIKKTSSQPGHGLRNIKDRVILLSGEFTLTSTISKGTRIDIRIPIKEEI